MADRDSEASTGGREVFLGYLSIVLWVLEYLIDIVLLFLLLFVSNLVGFFQNIYLYFS